MHCVARGGRLASLPRAALNALRFRRLTGATMGGLLREGRAMKEGQGLTWAQVAMAANAPMLTRASMVEGRLEAGILPTGQVVGVIDDVRNEGLEADVTFHSATTLTGSIAIDTGSGGGNVRFMGTVDSSGDGVDSDDHALSIIAGSGNVDFDAPVGDATDGALGSLTITSAAVATFVMILAAVYLLWMFQRTAFGTPKEEFAEAHIHDVHTPEWIAWAPLLALIVALGVYPHLLFRVTDGAVQVVTAALGAGG